VRTAWQAGASSVLVLSGREGLGFGVAGDAE
jgi:hypothetical protein